MEFKNGVSILETLTAALYADPLVVFREYVQNAVDGNPGTENSRTLQSDFEVNINIDLDHKRIVILDNGDGIPEALFDAKMRLLGSSQKGGDKIGFRGIGRLAGLSFCNDLSFTNISTGQSFTLYGEKYRTILKENPSWTLDEDIFEKITTPPPDELALHNEPDIEPASKGFGFKVVMNGINEVLLRAIADPIRMSKNELIPSREFIVALQKMLPLPYPNDFDKKDIIESELKKIGKKLVSYTIKLNSEKLYKQVRNIGDDAFIPMPVRLQDQNGEFVNVGLLWLSFAFMMRSMGEDYGIAVRSKNMLLQGGSVFASEATESDESITTYGQYLSATKAITGELLLDTPLLSDNSRRDWFNMDSAALQLRDFICLVMTRIHRYRYAFSRYANSDVRSDELKEKVYSTYRDILACGNLHDDGAVKDFVGSIDKKRKERPFDARYDETDIRGFSRTQKSFYRRMMQIVYAFFSDNKSYSTSDYYALKAFVVSNLNGDAVDLADKSASNRENQKQKIEDYKSAAEQGNVKAQNTKGWMLAHGRGVVTDKKAALEWFKKAADQGHVKAQDNLGLMYDLGDGVPQDKKKAVELYSKAAERGLANAQFHLGNMYRQGDGVVMDKQKAVEWYTKAAKQEHVKAQFNLAQMYRMGDGVAVDKAKAVEWYMKAAGQGEVKAQFNLALMYDNGDGVAVDKAKAVELYTKAAEQGNVGAQFHLGNMYYNGDGVAVDRAKAVEWWAKAAEQGLAPAQDNLGVMYDLGEGVAVDKAKAVELYTKAAEQGNVGAQFHLGNMYDNGDGVAVDKAKAVEWYTKAAGQGEVKAQFNLALMYDNGDGVAIDKAKAAELYTKAAEQGEIKAQFNLAQMYRIGDGVAVDKAKAAELYTKAAKQEHVKAQFNLAQMCRIGDGVAVDKAKAAEWYTKAAENGDVGAQFNLAVMYDNGDGVAVDKAKAVEWYTKAAGQGEVKAQFNLALMYDSGDGVAVDKAKALKLYTKAAEQGLAPAQNNLGWMYNNGDGVKIDKKEAVKWYEMAVAQDVPDSQFDLAMILYEGADGVKQDKKRAIELCKKAAKQGHEGAKQKLGWMIEGESNA